MYLVRIAAAEDRDAIRDIQSELDLERAAPAHALKIRAAARAVLLRKREGEGSFAADYGLDPVDGRPLYRYRLSDAAFAKLQADVARAARAGRLTGGSPAALFALWAAEWFRRSYRGTGLVWADVVVPLGVPLHRDILVQATKEGLRLWRRPLRTNDLGRDFIGSLLREGGFPVAAVEANGGGWARELMRGLVAPLLADAQSDLTVAQELARRTCARHQTKLFSDDDFATVCAELAFAIVSLRRQSEPLARAAGLPLTAWLHLHRPDWRDALPLSVTGAGAEALIGQMLEVEAAAIVGGDVGVDRFLMRKPGGVWFEAARLALDGGMRGSELAKVEPSEGRLRLFAHGALVRVLPGELGMADPPHDDERTWSCRSSRAAQGLHPVPFTVPIALDLRAGNRAVTTIGLPGGKARRGRLLVFERDETITGDALRLVGSGSGAYRVAHVVMQCPDEWKVAGDEGAMLESIGPGVGATQMWALSGVARVRDEMGDCYRIATSQTADSRPRLNIAGREVGWARVEGDVDLFVGSPTISAENTAGARRFVRPSGSPTWQPLTGELGPGVWEVALRDAELLLDKRLIAVLPHASTVAVSGRGSRTIWQLSGWGAVRLIPDGAAPLRVDTEHWSGRATDVPVTQFAAEIWWPAGARLPITMKFPQEATISRWDGRALQQGSEITLADLRTLVGCDEGPMDLVAELADDSENRPVCQTWHFDRELPMASIADDLADLLLPMPIDVRVCLDMHNGINDHWYLRSFANALELSPSGLLASQAIVDPNARLCGRPLGDPAVESDFGAYSLIVDANHRPMQMPDVAGDWLFYLRSGGVVLTRPKYIAASAARSTHSLVGQVMATPRSELAVAIAELLDAAERDDDEGARIVEELNALAVSLDGLPPMTFAVFDAMSTRPAVLARMALAATPEQRDAVIGLSRALPFAWYLIPKAHWNAAGQARLQTLMVALAELDGAIHFAMQQVGQITRALWEAEPVLQVLLQDACPATPRGAVNQAFLQRAHQRLDERPQWSRWREGRGLALPADHLVLPDFALEVLDTPYAAALAAHGQWLPGTSDVRHFKLTARRFPNFFADGFAAAFKELG